MLIKKNNFTLIEVLVCIFLIGMIFSLLFKFFTQITILEIKIDKAAEKIHQSNNFYVQLTNCFSKIKLKDFDKSPFYTKLESNKLIMHFCFDNGVDPDPDLSDVVDAMIYVNDEKKLILEIKKNENALTKSRKIILLKKVEKINYLFLSSKDEALKEHLSENITSKIGFYNFWPEEKKNLPQAILIDLDNNLKFAFFLPK